MKLLTSWRTFAVLVSIVLAVIIFSRCTPTVTQSQSTQVPAASPTPVDVEPTTTQEPEEIAPVVEESKSPKAKPTAEPSVSKTKEKIPTVKKSATPKPTPKPTLSNEPSPPPSAEPTTTPKPVESPKPGRTPDEYGYLVPIVTFNTKSCVIKGSSVLLTYNVSLSEGNHYSYQEPWRGGRIWTVRDGRSWSFEYVEALPSRLINEPIVILPDRSLEIICSGKTDYIPLPKLDFSLCK